MRESSAACLRRSLRRERGLRVHDTTIPRFSAWRKRPSIGPPPNVLSDPEVTNVSEHDFWVPITTAP